MSSQDDAGRSLLNIVRTLRNIPDRDKPCDQEVTSDGIRILLYRRNNNIQEQKARKSGIGRKTRGRGKL